MNLARIKTALDGIHESSLHSLNTETMSGIEPLPNSNNASPVGSPQGVSSKITRTYHHQTATRTQADALFSPVGDAKHEPDVVSVLAGARSDTLHRGSASEPTTGEKDRRSLHHQRGLSENKHHIDCSQRTKTGVHFEATSETVVNRALFVKNDHQSHASLGNIRGDTLSDDPSRTSHLTASETNGRKKPVDGSTYHYNVQSDRIDVDQQSPHDAFSSIYSADTIPPHYHDTSLTASTMSRTSQGQNEGGGSAPGVLSRRQQPTSSSPKYGFQGRSHPTDFQNQSLPPELAEIEHLRQNLSNMITSPGISQDESLSELLMLNKEHNKRQSTESARTDSLLGSQVFQGISPSIRPGSDSGLASYQPSHVTSSQRSGVSTTESSISRENRVLREGLEKERCRRRHCEDQIASLQSRILEMQQLLAVAQSTEKKKDNMIAQLDKTMAKVSASLKQREQEKIEMLDKLKTANIALLEEIDKQKIMMRDQSKELTESRQNCEDYKKSERAFRDQLKQHQAESAKRWEEAQQMAQLTNKQIESMGEDCLKAERQLKQVQATLAAEREEWKQKEVELEQRVSSSEMEKTASLDEMQRLLQDEKRTVDELNKDLIKIRREAEDSWKEKEKALREKEKVSLELSVETARWEAKLQKQEAEIQGREESKMAERVEKMKSDAVAMEETLRDRQRKQVTEMSERHMEELRVQKDVHQREMMQREQRWNDKQQQYQTRLAECQQEILKLSTKIEKVQHQRFSVVSKLQHFLQTQCNEAVMMVSTLDSSPKTPVNNVNQVTGQRGYTNNISQVTGQRAYTNNISQVTGQKAYTNKEVRGHETRAKPASVPYSSMEDEHSAQLKQAQEEARQAIQRLYLHKQDGGEDAPHEASFYPLDSAPSTPTNSEISQSTVYQDIDTSPVYSHHQQVHSHGLPDIPTDNHARHSKGVAQRLRTNQDVDSLPMSPHQTVQVNSHGQQVVSSHLHWLGEQRLHHSQTTNGIVGMSNGKFATPLQQSSQNNHQITDGLELGWTEVDQSDAGIFMEMMTSEDHGNETVMEKDIVGWMSKHNSTLTSSPTKEGPSPDINIHPGQGMLLQVPGSLGTPGHSQVKGHNMSELSTGPLDMLDSPVSSTQGDWREVALQKYITKLLEQSPGSTQQGNQAAQTSFNSGKPAIEKETVHSGFSHVMTAHGLGQPSRLDSGRRATPMEQGSAPPGGRGATMRTSKQVPGEANKGLVNKDKTQASVANTGTKSTTNRPRSAVNVSRDNPGNQTNKPNQKSKVWR